MKNSDKCQACGATVMSPWSLLQNRRRCILCGFEEDRPATEEKK